MLHAGAIFHRLLIEGSGKTWKQDQRIRLQHVDTGGYLHSHDKKYQRIAGGQQEVRTRNCYFFLQQLKAVCRFILLRVPMPSYITGTMLTQLEFYPLTIYASVQVCGVREKRADNVWLAAEGVYLPITESK